MLLASVAPVHMCTYYHTHIIRIDKNESLIKEDIEGPATSSHSTHWVTRLPPILTTQVLYFGLTERKQRIDSYKLCSDFPT